MTILPATSATGTGAFEQSGYSNNPGLFPSLSTVYAADIDGDGDVDSLTASFDNGQIAWQSNLGNGNFYQDINGNRIIATISNPTSAIAVNMDGDKDLDVVASLLGAPFVSSSFVW